MKKSILAMLVASLAISSFGLFSAKTALACNEKECEKKPPVCSVCGNGKVEKGEQCDDGNKNNNDSCNTKCQIQIIKKVPVEKIVEKEVIKEVPVEVIKEVPFETIVEVEKEVIREVPFIVEKEIIKEKEVKKIVYKDKKKKKKKKEEPKKTLPKTGFPVAGLGLITLSTAAAYGSYRKLKK